jgi:phosphatidylserine/phosphatidylglycerophosphate/cardiolipin synthase-like enzyme
MKTAALVAFLTISVAPFSVAEGGEVARVCFVPGEDCGAVIVSEIRAARKEILVQAYGFTLPAIVEALAKAARRGVRVSVLLDRSNACATEPRRRGREDDDDCGRKGAVAARVLLEAGADVRIDAAHAIAHNKVMVFDGERTITGSYNFTSSANSRNAENLLIVAGKDVAEAYASNHRRHAEHSTSAR